MVACLVAASAADAQDPGVFIDPGDPSAKEYAIPFEQERRQADPGQGASAPVAPGTRSSPTFGVGITSGNAPGPADDPGDGGSGKAQDDEPERERVSDADSAVVQAAAAQPGAPERGTEVTLMIAGIALGVLLAGGVAGLLWRRRA
jgi:hypothetical protein